MGREIQIYTDHKALIYLKIHHLLIPRITWWMLTLTSQLNIIITGIENVVADTLSRVHGRMLRASTKQLIGTIRLNTYRGNPNFVDKVKKSES